MKRNFILLSLILSTSLMFAQKPVMPSKLEVSRPKALENGVLRESAVTAFLQKEGYGQDNAASEAWTVFSDRDMNFTYSTPAYNASIYDTLKLNDAVRIARIQGDFALVISEEKTELKFPQISSVARCRGWIPMKNLLLWCSPLADEYDIYQKALIVANLDKTEKSSSVGTHRYLNPSKTTEASLIKPVRTSSKFYFIMKRASNGMVLLSETSKLEKGKKDLIGWVKPDTYIPWSQRSCLEPNWKPEVVQEFAGKGITADVYKVEGMNKGSLFSHYSFKEKLTSPNKDDKTELTRYRMPSNTLRYPILKTIGTSVYQTTFFVTVDGNMNEAIKLKSEMERKKDSLISLRDTMNIILVIDATKSMQSYYSSISNALDNSLTRFDKNAHIRVGIVLYRDYEDGDGLLEFQRMLPIRDQRVRAFLKSGGKYGVKNSSSNTTYTEALFQGLNLALNCAKMGYRPGQSNLMLVVGDCGNDANKDKAHGFHVTESDLIRKMIENRIQLMAFQVDSKRSWEWQYFQEQLVDAVSDNMDNVCTRWNTKKTSVKIKDKNGFLVGRDVHPMDTKPEDGIFVGSVRFAPEGMQMDPAQLTLLMDDKIGLFANAIEKQIGNLGKIEDELGGINTENSDLTASEIGCLNDDYSPEQIEFWRRHGSFLAKEGFTPQKIDNSNLWNPVIFISDEEFDQLLDKLKPLSEVATKIIKSVENDDAVDRKPYVNAMIGVASTMAGEKDIMTKSVEEIMNNIFGLNARSTLLGSFTLNQIEDEDKVNKDDFADLVKEFKRKYKILEEYRTGDYFYKWQPNKRGDYYYWIPVEDLP